MKKEELKALVGKRVRVEFKDQEIIEGILKYAEKGESNFPRLPNFFYIENIGFRVSCVRKVEVLK